VGEGRNRGEPETKGVVVNLIGILIGSEDPQRLTSFYKGLFGDPTWDMGGYTGWLLGAGALTIGPHDQVRGRSESPGRIIWNLESDDVKGDTERFRAAGATVVAEPYRPGEAGDDWIATFADPDGNYFQLMSPMRDEV
jgi:predicted enzyme related to lactoylglutathione lyase